MISHSNSLRYIQVRASVTRLLVSPRPLIFQSWHSNFSSTSRSLTSDKSKSLESSESSKSSGTDTDTESTKSFVSHGAPTEWEDRPDFNISKFSELPFEKFGYNQHIQINQEFKEALRQMLWTFKAPIRYAFAYGSGVFSQSPNSPKSQQPQSSNNSSLSSPHPHAPEAITKWQSNGGKVIDFIFGVSHTQHWHSLNIQQHPEHYSAIRHFGSGFVSKIQDNFGAGVYFNPYITINGTMIKYGVVNLDTLQNDLSHWDTLYLAGRLQKPVKILRDDPKVRLANQLNLISALRTALLMLGPKFTEKELYSTISGISYLGDPRMDLKSEDPNKIKNIVGNQLPNFRQLYAPLVTELPNVSFNDSQCQNKDFMLDPTCDCQMIQDMDPKRRGNMVRRLPVSFRNKVYMEYQKKWQIPGREFNQMMEKSKDEDEGGFKKKEAAEFDIRIAKEVDIGNVVSKSIKQTVSWPSWTQSVKGFVTAGVKKSWKYVGEKRAKAVAK